MLAILRDAMTPADLSKRPLSFMRLLVTLRWVAVAGQAVTVAVVTGPLQVAIPLAPLWSGIAALAAFNVYATWRSRRAPDPRSRELFAHVLADIAALTWMIAWSGGIENPFSSLFLLPLALSVLTLPARWVWATAAASVGGYCLSAALGLELPHVHGLMGDTFSLHKFGMLVNFLISAIVILVFFARMAAAIRENQRALARLQEQFARNEGIVSLATHAASVAHELNTPLGTLTLMVDDLIEDGGDARQREHYENMKALLQLCRDRVRELAAPADSLADGRPACDVDLERVIERWQLVRPTIDLHRSGSMAGCDKVDPAVGHLLQVLLNNAADAGEQAGLPRVDLKLQAEGGRLRGEIRDYGVGFEKAQPLLPGRLFRTSKPGGMGIGLALSHATIERLGGELSMESTPEGRGVQVAFSVPIAAAVRA